MTPSQLRKLAPYFSTIETLYTISGTGSNQICLNAPDRWSLIVSLASCYTGATLYLTTDPTTLADKQGIVIYSGTAPLKLDEATHGNLVKMPLFGIATTGSVAIGFCEIMKLGD